jgi:phospholipid-binding lipoprotein MlaA
VINYARVGATAIDTYGRVKDDLDKIVETSIDPYAAIRSMYRQKRRAAVLNGAPPASPAIPDFQYGHAEPEGEPALSQLPADRGAAGNRNMMRFLRIGGR